MNKVIKFFVLVFMQFLLSVSLYAQKDVTQFLGIPVDGSKPEMIKKLKEKGFVSSTSDKDVLVGEFNGEEVNIYIVTDNNKVWRIMVCDISSRDEQQIRIRFNKLIQQFQNNKSYVDLPESIISKYIISENEKISYEMTVHNKQYTASFYQKTKELYSIDIEQDNLDKLELLNDTIDLEQRMLLFHKRASLISMRISEIGNDEYLNKNVWFRIGRDSRGFFIAMYYDNEYNRAKGEDL